MVASGEGGFTSVLTEIRTNGDTVDLLASDAKQLRIESGSQCVLMTLRPDQ